MHFNVFLIEDVNFITDLVVIHWTKYLLFILFLLIIEMSAVCLLSVAQPLDNLKRLYSFSMNFQVTIDFPAF